MSRKTVITLLLTLTVAASVGTTYASAQQAQSEDISRRAKIRVDPVYPELAKKMKLTGTVKIELVVATNGAVKEARVVGGHPVLAGAALDAAKKWKFEPSQTENSGVIDFKFEPR